MKKFVATAILFTFCFLITFSFTLSNKSIDKYVTAYENAKTNTLNDFQQIDLLKGKALKSYVKATKKLEREKFKKRIDKKSKSVSLKLMDFASKNIVEKFDEDGSATITNGHTPFVYPLEDGGFRLYFSKMGNIYSAISDDGLKFQLEDGIRQSGGEHPSIVKTGDGKYRMYFGQYYNNSKFGQMHKLASAISDDGINFTFEGAIIDPSSHFANYHSAMEAITLPNGSIRIYYVSDNVYNTKEWEDSFDYEKKTGITSMISKDGRIFELESGKRISLINFNDPGIIQLTDNYSWIITSHAQGPESGYKYGVYGFMTNNGLTLSKPSCLIPQTSADTMIKAFDPSIIKIDNETYRVFYGQGDDIKSSTIKINTSVLQLLE